MGYENVCILISGKITGTTRLLWFVVYVDDWIPKFKNKINENKCENKCHFFPICGHNSITEYIKY